MSRWSPKRLLTKGLLILSLGIGGFVAWSTIAEIDGAVVAAGQVAVEARAQAIQHPDGGLVVALHVRDGSAVAAGDPVLTLDGSELLAQQVVSQRSLIELLARMDRLRAEIRGAEEIAFGGELRDYASNATDVASILSDETALFEARRAALDQTEAQLRERQVQTEAIVAGRERQLDASQRQLVLIEEDLATQESLFERGLTESTRLSGLRHEAARLDGEIGELEAGIAEARSAIAGFEVERLQQEAAFREAAQAELRELQPREAEIRERLRLIATQTNRLVLRAPMAGTVLGLQVHTVGGVVPAGAEVASIIPADVPLILSVEVDPGQIDRVHVGQTEHELRAMRCAIHSCERAMAAMEDFARKEIPKGGVTEDDVWAVLHAENIKRGGEWIETRLLTSGPRTNPWFQECGPRIISENEILAFDTDLIGPYGICADLSRTWWIGDDLAPKHMRESYAEAVAHIRYNTALLRPGLHMEELTRSLHVLQEKYDALKYSSPLHGVGMCDEWPLIAYPDRLVSGAFDAVLEPGFTLCIEALVGEVGGDHMIKLEDQGVVTNDGFDTMSNYPLDERFL